MEPLSGVDAAFLHLETSETPMHVGSVSLFDLPAVTSAAADLPAMMSRCVWRAAAAA
jgi:hypothetical protein